MKIYIGADHGGVELKNKIIDYLKQENIEVEESTVQNHELDDYPDFALDIAKKVINNQGALGILICRNGIGISIAANKVKGIRCARVVNSDDAFKAKNHNGANIIALGNLEGDSFKEIVDMFISTKFASEERHLKRINKIQKIEEDQCES